MKHKKETYSGQGPSLRRLLQEAKVFELIRDYDDPFAEAAKRKVEQPEREVYWDEVIKILKENMQRVMTDEEYARAEEAEQRKRDAREGFE